MRLTVKTAYKPYHSSNTSHSNLLFLTSFCFPSLSLSLSLLSPFLIYFVFSIASVHMAMNILFFFRWGGDITFLSLLTWCWSFNFSGSGIYSVFIFPNLSKSISSLVKTFTKYVCCPCWFITFLVWIKGVLEVVKLTLHFRNEGN